MGERVTCSYLVRKNRMNKLSPRVECGRTAVVVYLSDVPDAYGMTEHPRCEGHDTTKAQAFVAKTVGWHREVIA